MGLAYVVEGVGVEWAVVSGDLRWRRCGGRITQRRRGRGGSRRRIGGDWASRLGGDWSIGLLTGVGGFSSLGCEPVNFCDFAACPPWRRVCWRTGFRLVVRKTPAGRRRYREFSERNAMADQPVTVPSGDVDSIEMKTRVAISRREFARRAVVASAVATIVPAAVTAAAMPATSLGGSSATQDTAPPAPPAAVAQQNPVPGAPKLSVEGQSEADARFQTILVMYGARFSDEQKNDLRRLCAVVQPSLDHIRAYKVENGDGTALYLKPGFEREKKAKVAAPGAAGKAAGGQGVPATKAGPNGGTKKP
jgi:hypothetical protein